MNCELHHGIPSDGGSIQFFVVGAICLKPNDDMMGLVMDLPFLIRHRPEFLGIFGG